MTEVPVPVCDDPYYLAPPELADGRDASVELTAWLMSLPQGAKADLGGLTYRCETTVKLPDRVGLTIRNGTLLRTVKTEDPNFYYPKPNPHLWLLDPVDCVVQDLTVRGTNTVPDQRAGFGSYLRQYEFDAAVRLQRFTNVTIEGLNADAVWGDGVQLQVGTGAVVRDCVIDRNGRQGVAILAMDVLIDNVRVAHSRRSGFDIEPDTTTQAVGNIEIRNSYTNTIGIAFAAAGRGDVNDVWIHHNRSAGPTGTVLYCIPSTTVSRRRRWRFEDHVAENNLGTPQAVVRFANSDDIQVRRVTLPVVATQSRLAFKFASCGGDCVVEDSNFGSALWYVNDTPSAGQTLTVRNNIPELSLKVS